MARTKERRQIKELRKEELILAALRSINKHGYVNTTINTIAEESGLSRGLINHYFESKLDLLISAHRHYIRNVDDFMKHLLSNAKGNFQKLLFTVYSLFLRDTGYNKMMVHYYSGALIIPEIREFHRNRMRKYRSNIERRIKILAKERNLQMDSRLSAIAVAQLGFGLWLGWVVEDRYTQEDCRRILREWICRHFNENPEDHPLTPDFDLVNFKTSAPLEYLT